MLVNLRDICAIAEQNNMAIPSFNVPSMEALRAAIDAAEKTGYPVIIAHAEGHEPFAPLDKIGPICNGRSCGAFQCLGLRTS